MNTAALASTKQVDAPFEDCSTVCLAASFSPPRVLLRTRKDDATHPWSASIIVLQLDMSKDASEKEEEEKVGKKRLRRTLGRHGFGTTRDGEEDTAGTKGPRNSRERSETKTERNRGEGTREADVRRVKEAQGSETCEKVDHGSNIASRPSAA